MPAHHGKYVAYYRVSTDRQGKSGLGLEAQKAAVADRLNGGRWQLAAEFTEIESGNAPHGLSLMPRSQRARSIRHADRGEARSSIPQRGLPAEAD